MKITVYWVCPEEESEAWNARHCLYAYLGPPRDEILYIGKSWGVSVRQRWVRSSKSDFWDDLERKRRIRQHRSVVGLVELASEARLTHQLLADIESLLIYVEQPWGNIQSRVSRIQRPGSRFAVAESGQAVASIMIRDVSDVGGFA
jgi:hypothetical protein